MNDKERIAELADAFNKVCDENADFVAESIKADRRIAELECDVKDLLADIARLTTEAYTREAEVKMMREWLDNNTTLYNTAEYDAPDMAAVSNRT